MNKFGEWKMSFNEILEEVEKLEVDEQIELQEIIKKRLIEKQRRILAEEIAFAKNELKNGILKPQSVEEIMNDLTYEL